jgi:hypothetical protein
MDFYPFEFLRADAGLGSVPISLLEGPASGGAIAMIQPEVPDVTVRWEGTMRRRDVLRGGAAALLGPAAAGAEPFNSDVGGDIEILEAAYTQLHPGLYRYTTPAEMRTRFQQLKRFFAEARPLRDKYLALSWLLATVRCGHTYANFYNQSHAVQTALFDGGGRLPFYFRWLSGRMIVTRNQSDDPRLVPGAEIVSVNNQSPSAILESLLHYARADGGNDAKRRALLEVQGSDRYETFDVFYRLLYPAADDGFEIKARLPDGRLLQVRVAALDLATRRAAMAVGLGGAGDAPQWTLSDKNGVAVLKMPSWALYNSTWDWRSYLDATFASIEQARGLIVDLRGNEGGLDCGNEIVARLIDAELPLSDDERRVRFRATPADLNPYLDTWDNSFRTLGEGAEDLGNGFFRLPAAAGAASIQAKGPRFRAPVIVLINSQNSSATFQFSEIIQSRRLGRLFGASTGGNQRGINGGAFFFLRLPGTGLEADLPLIGRFPLVAKPDAGLPPDVRVEDTREDIAAGRDSVLETALRTFN